MSTEPQTSPKASSRDQSLDVLPPELRNTIMEKKFAQIREQRQDARNVLREAKQRTRNQQTDQQILLLMQADERLAALLSQAADSMRALLPVTPPASPDAFRLGSESTEPVAPAHGAKGFEDKAQQWFTILNEVQYTLRSAVRYLRDAHHNPLTAPVGAEARQTGRAGSMSRGHSLSLLDAFADLSGVDGPTFKLPPVNTSGPTTPRPSLPEASLSLQALRERERNWKALSGSLQRIYQYTDANSKGTPESSASPQTPPPELSLLESIRNGCSSDRILIDALVNTNNTA